MKTGIAAVLKVSDCEEVFRRYSALDLEAVNAQAPVLSYESFLAVLVDFSNRLRNKDIPYLSEGLRDYILNYLARANRITPQVGLSVFSLFFLCFFSINQSQCSVGGFRV